MPKPRIVFYSFYFACFIAWFISVYAYLHWFIAYLPLHFDFLHVAVAGLILFVSFRRILWREWKPQVGGFTKLSLIFCMLGLAGLFFFKTHTGIRIFGFCSAMFFFYGLICPLLGEKRWYRGLSPFLLLLFCLPFGRHIDIFIGYPLRVMLVDLVYQSLSPIFPSIESFSGILLIENRAAFIDMDCSGIKGLWVSTLIYFTLSWIEAVRMSSKWFLGFFLFMAWIIIGNFIRIFLLVIIHTALGRPEFDPLIHHSVSLLFLLSGCYFSFLWMKSQKSGFSETPNTSKLVAPILPSICSLGLLLLLAWSPTLAESPNKEIALQESIVHRLESLCWSPINLSRTEADVFERESVQASKWIKGELEMILVLNGDWRSQHKPELCYESSGYRLSANETLILDSSFTVRQLAFENTKSKVWYWFQQEYQTSSDFSEKVWKQLFHQNQKWTMISIVHNSGSIPLSDIKNIKLLLQTTYPHESTH